MKKFLLSIFAVLFAFAGVQAQVWTKVTDASTLQAGDQLVIACSSKGVVASSLSSSYLDKATATFSSDKSTITTLPSNATVLTLGGSEGAWILANASGTQLGATAAKKVAWVGGTKTWSISITNGSATIQSTTSSYGRFLYNSSSPRFTTYTSSTSSSMILPELYRLETSTGGETPDVPVVQAPDAPTLPASCNFDGSMTVTITSDATVYYTTDGTTPSKTNGTEYTAPFEITATTTVKAVAVNEGGASDVVSATYTKNEPVTPPAEGAVVDEITRDLTGATGSSYVSWSGKTVSSDAVYAGNSAGSYSSIQLRSSSNSGLVTTQSGGKAKKVVIVWNSNTTADRTLDVYGKNSAYTGTSDLYNTEKRGTKIGSIVCGTSTELTIDDDYEYIGLRSNSGAMYLTSVSITWDASAGVTPVAPNAPVLTESQAFKGSLEVTITSDATVYYTTDGTTPSKTNGTEYTAPFEITATTTVKAVAVNEVGESEVAEATYTLFVVEETAGYYVKVVSAPADWSGKYLVVYEEGADAYVFNGKDETNGYVSAVTDGDVIKANSEIDAVAVTIAAMEGGYSVKTADGYISGIASGNKLNFDAKEQLNTIEMGTDGVDICAGRYLRFNSASGDMRFRYYNQTYGESVQLYKYVTELPSYQLSVTDAGYATLFLDFKAAIPTNVEVYIIKEDGINNNYITLTQVAGVLPANTGVIVKATKGDYTFAYSAGEVADVAGNLLEGSVTDKNIEGEAYVLGVVNGEVGLYKAQASGTSWKNNANKAYLPMSAVANKSAQFFGFDWDGTTGVEEVKTENGEVKTIFDLTGRRVEEITAPGVYIVGGKKVLVK